jgi:hypothetical protein
MGTEQWMLNTGWLAMKKEIIESYRLHVEADIPVHHSMKT